MTVDNMLSPKGQKGTVYLYARVSSKRQSLDRQLSNLTAAYPEGIVCSEIFTGTTMARPKWERLLCRLKPGDTICFDSVSRMARNANEGVETYLKLYDEGINLVFLKEPHISTTVYRQDLKDKLELTGSDEDAIFKGLNDYFRLLATRQIRLAFEQSEKEVTDLHQRTKEALRIAKIKGIRLGRHPGKKYKSKKEDAAKEVIYKHSKTYGGSLTDRECWDLAHVSEKTFRKYKREMAAEILKKQEELEWGSMKD